MTPYPTPRHASVLTAEVARLLDPKPGETWVDGTVGAGGHARLIAERIAPGGRLIGLDQDAAMLDLARPRLDGLPVTLVHANFDQLPEVLANLGIEKVDGVLADLGFASDQVDDPARGLSFQEDGPLDMRLDPTTGQTAADLVNRMSEKALADLIYEYGEERHSRRIARRIVERRKEKPFETTGELAEVVRRSVPRSGEHRPGDADVPGAADRGQRRTRRAGPAAGRAAEAAAARRAGGGHQLPLAGGPAGEARLPRPGGVGRGDEEAGGGVRRGDGRQPAGPQCASCGWRYASNPPGSSRMNGPPDLPTDRIPMPMPGVPEPAVPLPPVRTPVATEPTPEEPAAVAGPTGAPAPQPRWVKEAVRDLVSMNRKKLVVLSTAGSVVAVGLALNALFTGAGLAPEPPRQEQSAEPKSLASARRSRPSRRRANRRRP